MILPNDILIRATSDGQTVWVSQRMVCEACGVDEEVLRVSTKRYKSSLPPSWRKVADQSEFFLGKKEGKAWRWGRKGGQYYYDYDHIPNRKPTCYRDLLPSKEELIGAVEDQKLDSSRTRRNRIVDTLDEKVKNYESVDDFIYFSTFTIGDKDIFDTRRARDLQQAAAWCRFLKNAPALIENGSLGFRTLTGLYKVCAARIEKLDLTGFRIKSAESLRKKIAALPDGEAMLAALVSGKYCNDNRRILGKSEIVDYATGEALITIREGKFHQIKRMLASRGKPVVYLKRLSMGSLTLDEGLSKGEYRLLTAEEIKNLRESGQFAQGKAGADK